VLPAVPPELFVATRFADFVPAGVTGLNETCTRQLDVDVSVAPQSVVPSAKLAASVPVTLNFVAASVSGVSPVFLSVNVFAALVSRSAGCRTQRW
jgi:hypothetical protein